MGETKMSCKGSLPRNDQGRYESEFWRIRRTERVGHEKVHAVVFHSQFLVPSKDEVFRKWDDQMSF